jgi:hypothetical protein
LDTSSSSSKLSLVRSRTSKTVRSELSSERTIGDFSNGFALNKEGVVLVVVLNAFEKEQTRGADDDDEAPLLLQREEEKDDEEDCIVVKFCREC